MLRELLPCLRTSVFTFALLAFWASLKAPERLETLFSRILLPVSKRVSAKQHSGRSRRTTLNLKLAPLWKKKLTKLQDTQSEKPRQRDLPEGFPQANTSRPPGVAPQQQRRPSRTSFCIVNAEWRFQIALLSSDKQVFCNQRRCEMLSQDLV